MGLDNRRGYANTTNYTNGVFCFHSVHANRRLREALATDEGETWVADVEKLIAVERAKL